MIQSRRAIIAGGLAGLVASQAIFSSRSLAAPRRSNRSTVLHSVFESWRRLDVEAIAAHLTDDIVWYNSGGLRPPVIGKPSVTQAITRLAGHIQRSNWHLLSFTEAGDRIWVEGLDDLINMSGHRVVVPFLSIWEFKGDRIAAWHDFSNPKLREALAAGQPVPPHIEDMLARAATTANAAR